MSIRRKPAIAKARLLLASAAILVFTVLRCDDSFMASLLVFVCGLIALHHLFSLSSCAFYWLKITSNSLAGRRRRGQRRRCRQPAADPGIRAGHSGPHAAQDGWAGSAQTPACTRQPHAGADPDGTRRTQ